MAEPTTEMPSGPLVAWYGDDFTGAAAVMEVLTFAGLPAMLFLDPPNATQLARYPGLKGIGVASTARAQSPEWMDAALPNVFACLKALNPAIMHYKTCSTLDSSPQVGSIGRAIEIGSAQFAAKLVPIMIAAPQLRRYQAFGHLFASAGDAVYRLDRHPVMSRHPVTPMGESDVARHITLQSDRLEISCLSLEDLAAGRVPEPGLECRHDIEAITLDCVDAVSESKVGRFIWENRTINPFVVGSQGVEYALVRHWQDSGLLQPTSPTAGIGPSEGMVVVSGSVSSTTAQQIAWSLENGFAGVPFDAAAICQSDVAAENEIMRVVAAAADALGNGRDPLIYTAQGPEDPAVTRFKTAVAASGQDMPTVNRRVGEALGRVLQNVLARTGTRRAVVSGGDTSGYATRQLGIFALTALAPTIPGAAIFKAHADGPMDGLELALKGGQMGSHDYLSWVRNGGGAR
jgi:3-oxoisoapionate kinase